MQSACDLINLLSADYIKRPLDVNPLVGYYSDNIHLIRVKCKLPFRLYVRRVSGILVEHEIRTFTTKPGGLKEQNSIFYGGNDDD